MRRQLGRTVCGRSARTAAARPLVEGLESRRLMCAEGHGTDSLEYLDRANGADEQPPRVNRVVDFYATSTPAEPVAVTAAAGGTVLRIDAAGANGFTDTAGKFWGPDAFFTGGSPNTGTFAVANTADDALYATRRTGVFSYAAGVENGDYTLRLLFTDWHDAAGKRKFNVDVEGARRLTNLDIAAEVGPRAALVKTFNVTVADGKLDMAFTRGTVADPTLSAFELVPAGPVTVPAAPAALDATGLSGGRIRVTWQDNSSNEDNFQVERSSDGGTTFTRVATPGANVTAFEDTGRDPARTYTYRVRATNTAGASAFSNTDSAKALAASTFTKISWSTAAAAPIARSEALHATVDGKLYVFGGFSGGGPVARSDVYDPATNSWRRIADMRRRLTHAGTAVDGHNVYFAGGYIGTGTGYTQQFGTKEVWRYNTDSNSYSTMPALPTAVASGGLVLVGRNLHYFGGNNSSRRDVNVHYVLNLNNTAAGWATKKSMPTARSHMGYVNLGDKVYAVGGQKGNDGALVAQSVVEMYDPSNDTWTARKSMHKGVNHISGSTFVMGGRILTLGGQTKHGSSIADVYAFDPVANAWTTLSPLPAPRFSGVAAEVNGVIVFTGGSSKTTTWKGVVS